MAASKRVMVCSGGTAAVRGDTDINDGAVHYWEVSTSGQGHPMAMMFGVCTQDARLHSKRECTLLGEDEKSWALCNSGKLHHGGQSKPYTESFTRRVPTTIGILFDSQSGTLEFYKDSKHLGIAFTGLKTDKRLYPAIACTAATTEMTLGVRRRTFVSLQDQCRRVIVRACASSDIDKLPLPRALRDYVQQLNRHRADKN